VNLPGVDFEVDATENRFAAFFGYGRVQVLQF
jgi:hypothetical protein